MPLVTSEGFQLAPNISPITQQIGQALQRRRTQQRTDELAAQKQKAIQLKDESLRMALEINRIKRLPDNTAKRTAIAKKSQEIIAQGGNASRLSDLLRVTNPDELNLGLDKLGLEFGDAGKMFDQMLKASAATEQFEPVLDAEGNIVAQRNVQTGQVIADPRAGLRGKEREKALKDDLKLTKDQFDRSSKLRAEISKTSVDFNKQRGAWGRVQASAENPSPAGDLALIFNFMKVLDPASTVRESEFAQVGAAGNLPTQTQRLYEQWATGQKLTAGQRKDVVDRAEKLFLSAEKMNKKDVGKIISIGKQFGISKKLLLGAEQEQKKGDLTTEERLELENLRKRFPK